MTTLTEAWRIGMGQGVQRQRRQIAVPIVIFVATLVRTFSPWTLPIAGITLVVWSAFLVSVALGLFVAGVACFGVRALYELQGRK